MSSTVNSPKISTSFHIPILRNHSKYSPSIEKTSHRSSFHLSNLFQSLTKFSRTIRTTNSFVRSNESRRSFTKANSSTNSNTNRPSSCFVLLSPVKQDQPSSNTHSNSSFHKIKRVSSFLLPLKRRQSLSLNHSLNDRSFKAKESTKRRSRLLNYSIFRPRTSLTNKQSPSFNGQFGVDIRKPTVDLSKQFHIQFDLIRIDLILEIRLNSFHSYHYTNLTIDVPHWSTIELLKPFFAVRIHKQTLTVFRPKLFEKNFGEHDSLSTDFIYLPLNQLKTDEKHSIQLGWIRQAPTTIDIPFKWITKNAFDDYEISAKVCL